MTTTCLSEIPFPEDSVVVFDLDDTLVPERDFVISGFAAVAKALGEPVGGRMKEEFDAGEKDAIGAVLESLGSPVPKPDLLRIYREHKPALNLAPGVREMLERLKSVGHPLGLITDGRSVTQRNKIEALKIGSLLDEIVISEEFGSAKPDERNFRHFEAVFPGRRCLYVGDNVKKDFVTPNRLGWITVCLLDAGFNIHPQIFVELGKDYLPQFRIERLA